MHITQQDMKQNGLFIFGVVLWGIVIAGMVVDISHPTLAAAQGMTSGNTDSPSRTSAKTSTPLTIRINGQDYPVASGVVELRSSPGMQFYAAPMGTDGPLVINISNSIDERRVREILHEEMKDMGFTLEDRPQ